jgi:predicted Zn-dependent protease
MRAQDRDAEAERILRDGLRQTPGAAALHHTLGLTLVRLQRTVEALDELRRATQRAPTEARFAYVYAVGLYSDGKTKAAIAEVDRALQQHPDNRDLLVAATNFRQESGDLPGARRYALRLYERYPNDLDAALLARQLGALR